MRSPSQSVDDRRSTSTSPLRSRTISKQVSVVVQTTTRDEVTLIQPGRDAPNDNPSTTPSCGTDRIAAKTPWPRLPGSTDSTSRCFQEPDVRRGNISGEIFSEVYYLVSNNNNKIIIISIFVKRHKIVTSEALTDGRISITISGLACVYCAYLFRFIKLCIFLCCLLLFVRTLPQ